MWRKFKNFIQHLRNRKDPSKISLNEVLVKGRDGDFEYEAEFRDSRLDIYAKPPAVAVLTAELVKFFIAAGGTNFVTFGIEHPFEGRFEVTVQRAGGQLPSEKLNEVHDLACVLDEDLDAYFKMEAHK